MTEDHIGVKIDGVIYVKLEDVKPMRDRIEKLDAELVRAFNHMMEDGRRIEKLEAALREVLSLGDWGTNILARTVILEALEAKD